MPLALCTLLAREIKAVAYAGDDFTTRERLYVLKRVAELRATIAQAERIVQTPVPLHYARHTSRFLSVWCFTLPLCLAPMVPAYVAPPVVGVVSWALLGLREIGLLIENPFRRSLQLTMRSAAAATALPEILDLLAPYGSPALNVPTDVATKVDDAVRRLERDAPPAPLSALDGRWRVEYATAPSPSNGALGPRAARSSTAPRRSYVNELTLFDALTVAVRASFEPRADDELRVTFEAIEVAAFGTRLFAKPFPPGVERTWCLTYTDAATRVVRAGVDGGRSVARDVGLLERDAGEAKARPLRGRGLGGRGLRPSRR
ncbi:PAP fibrillin [Aureococcus anophagefferens]|nr:PAP fibrillin [Aureococcus anophagefferens]